MPRAWKKRKIMADISVIIVNHNAAQFVRAAIASLAAATPRSFETIVMDNSDSPTDDCGADIYRTVENRGFGTACNLTGDGALTLMLTGYAKKHNIEEVPADNIL